MIPQFACPAPYRISDSTNGIRGTRAGISRTKNREVELVRTLTFERGAPMFEEKTRRSVRRFNRRIASYRRGILRQIHQPNDSTDTDTERETSRIPTRQERRVDEAFRQDLQDVELA